jgi:hypothetical protein
MKTTVATIALCFGLSSANAQHLKEAEVPSNVKDGFAKKYPGSKVDEWEKEGAGFEAEFHLSKVESSAVFDASGTFKELEQEIKTSALPKGVTDYCTKNYPGYKLSEAAKITDAAGKVMYEAEMEKDKTHFDALFDENGNFVKKEEATKEEEGKD